ncbi:hypothetical protein [Aquimarina algiphila]|uniref:hypothetical protein n=1 Tax=Aquimarina algiphila TaxID=2047982 RepID=UPI00232BE319|nr:hypothetical protein [Aquimarina algiphila]
MEYIIGFLMIGILGGLLIYKITKRKKYVIIFSIIILLMFLLPWILLFLAFSTGAEFPD